jgi:hypothetical protein
LGKLINRNEKTVWVAYHNAIKKNPSEIKANETDQFVPISIFNRELTAMEAIIIYLKNKGLRYSEIGQILNRDQRNIWTIYSRALKKE